MLLHTRDLQDSDILCRITQLLSDEPSRRQVELKDVQLLLTQLIMTWDSTIGCFSLTFDWMGKSDHRPLPPLENKPIVQFLDQFSHFNYFTINLDTITHIVVLKIVFYLY